MNANVEEQNRADKVMELVVQLKKHATEDVPVLVENVPGNDLKKLKQHILLADEERKRVRELQKGLQTIEKPTLTETEQSEVEICEEQAIAALSLLQEKIDGLHKDVELVEQSFKRQEDINKAIADVGVDLLNLSEKYRTPQKLLIAEDDIRKSIALNERIRATEKQLKDHEQCVAENSLKNEDISEASKLAGEKIDNQKHTLANLLAQLRNDVNSTRQLDAEKDIILKEFDALANQAKEVHSLSDHDQKTKQLVALKKEAELLQQKLLQLRGVADENPQLFVAQLDSLELDPVAENLEELTKLLSNEEKDATRKLINAAADSKIDNQMQSIENALQKAANVDLDQNATEEDLRFALSTLTNSNSISEAVEQVCDMLNIEDPDANLIRNKAIERLSKSGEEAKTLAQSISDRLDALNNFTKLSNDLVNELEEIEQLISQQKTQNATPSAVEKLTAKCEELTPKMLTLADAVDNLSPLIQPKSSYEKIAKRQQELTDDARAAHAAAVVKEKHQNATVEYTKEVKEIESALQAVEQKHQDLPKMKSSEIDELQNSAIQPLQKMLNDLQSKETPTDELEKQKNLLANRLLLLQRDTSVRRNEAAEQENLAQKLEKDVSDYERGLADMLTRYDSPQPMSVAEDDMNVLRPMKEAIIALPLADLKDKTIREMLLKRIQPLHVQANVSKFLIIPLRQLSWVVGKN